MATVEVKFCNCRLTYLYIPCCPCLSDSVHAILNLAIQTFIWAISHSGNRWRAWGANNCTINLKAIAELHLQKLNQKQQLFDW